MHRDRITLVALSLTLGLGVAVGCTDSEPININNHMTGTAGNTNPGTAGNTSGTAGSTAGSAGATGTAGNTSGTAGSMSGTAGGTGGAMGTAGAGGTGGATGTAGAGGAGTAGAGGHGGAGGAGGAGGGGGGTAGAGGGGGTAVVLSFATDIMPIITASCHNCHQTGADGGLSMKADTMMTAYKALVGTGAGAPVTTSKNCKFPDAVTMRVMPGDPAHSLMYLKITTPDAMLLTAMCGDSMPKDKPTMPLGTANAASAMKIHDWIIQGAKP